MQDNIEQAIAEKSSLPTGGTEGQVLAKASDNDNDVEWIDNEGGATGDTLPIGSIVSYGGLNAPSNWLICDGSIISRTEYAELYSALGTIYGAGDGSTTFNLPDLRDKFILGAGNSHISGETGGEEEHTLTIDEMPSHNHSKTSKVGVSGSINTDYWASATSGTSDSATAYVSDTGGSQPHNNMPPYTTTIFIIKAKQSSGLVATVVDNLESLSTTDGLSANQGRVLNERFNYSTEERIIGKWIDGKTLYEKTYECINPPAGETTEISLEDINYDFITITEASLHNSMYVFTLNRYNASNSSDTVEYYIHKKHKALCFNIGAPWSNCTFYATIHYTKTTD